MKRLWKIGIVAVVLCFPSSFVEASVVSPLPPLPPCGSMLPQCPPPCDWPFPLCERMPAPGSGLGII
jgi:hypothetical protein